MVFVRVSKSKYSKAKTENQNRVILKKVKWLLWALINGTFIKRLIPGHDWVNSHSLIKLLIEFLCSQSTDLVSGKKKIKILSTTLLLLNVMTLYKNEFYRLKHELVGPYMQIQPNHNSDTFVEKWLLYLITKLNNIYLIPEETSIPKISTRRAFLFL